jgi:ABC-type uncharacterized transport system permease subunit
MELQNTSTIALSVAFACFGIMMTIIGFLAKFVFSVMWKKLEKNEKAIQALWTHIRGSGRTKN